MTKYRFKTEEEFKEDDLWNYEICAPNGWNDQGAMNEYLGKNIPDAFNDEIDKNIAFSASDWRFQPNNCILNSTELSE